MDWFLLPSWNKHGIFVIWKVVLQTLPTIRRGLTWQICNGSMVRIGVDPWIGCSNLYQLPPDLTAFLNNRGIVTIAHIVDQLNSTIFQQAWKSTAILGILELWTQEWRQYTNALSKSPVRIRDDKDELIWAPAAHGAYTPKEGYPIILTAHKPTILESWWCLIWKLKAPPRTCLFMWNMIMNKTPTGSNLMKRSFHGPFWCVICHREEETNDHLFMSCTITQQIWEQVLSTLNITQRWEENNIKEA